MQYRNWISALDLQQWARAADAKLLTPQLLRRLVHATVDKAALERVDFPAGEQVYRPGYDGVTKTRVGNFKVPAGITYWEIGAGANTKGKFDADYTKRVQNRGEGDFKDVTYIAVTPHSYRDKANWVAEKKQKNDWGDVRIYDSDDFEQWVEQAPSVGIWFSRLIGKTPEGVGDLSSRWEILKACLKRSLPPSLLLIGRESTTKAFQEWLDAPPGLLKVVGHSPQEVVDVFTAWVETLTPDLQSPIASRAVIADTPEGWRGLTTSVNGLILIASENLELDETLIALTRGKGHHVLIPSVTIGSGGKGVHRLQRLNRADFGTKLVEAGLSEQEGQTLANQCGGSFTIFKRLFSSSPEIKRPKWAEPSEAADLAALSLIGAWREPAIVDQGIVSKIAGKPYPDCVKLLNQWRKLPDSPVRLTADIWEFVSPLDAWFFLHHALSTHYLDGLEDVVEEVLGSNNPAYELPKEERWQAGVKGKIQKFSPEIRHGLAQSLAVLATQPIPDEMANAVPLPARAYRVVEKLLQAGVGWERWASLGSVLPLLAEAAPGAFMQAVEADLNSASPQIPLLFHQEVSGITGRAEHTGLLWALERLAWSDTHIAKASDLLARLSEKDPGGQWANRPQASLRDVFFSWMPYTTASLDQRLHLIGGITKRYPDVGWKLILDLLPRASDSIGRNSPPEWNFWAEGWTPGVSHADYTKTLTELVSMAISVLRKEPHRWIDLLRAFDFLPFREKEAILTELETVDANSLSDSQRQLFWKTLRDRLQRYRFYPEAPTTPPQEVVSRLERIRVKFEPTDIIELIVPSFGNGFGMLGGRDMPWEEQEKLRQKSRSDGLKRVLKSRGLDGVLELAAKAPDAFGVGITLGEVAGEQYLAQTIPGQLVSENDKHATFASGYLVWLNNKNGRDWAERTVSNDWTPEETGVFAIYLPFDPRTWAFIKSRGDSQNAVYWKRIRPHPNGLTPAEVAQAVQLLIQAKRSPSAIYLLSASTYQKNAPAPQVLFDLLDLAFNSPSDENRKLEDPHEIHAILAVIYTDENIDESRLAKMEWDLLPIFDRHTMLPHGLHRLLARDPKSFVDLLTLLFRNENEPDSDEAVERVVEPAEKQKRENAWRLLHDFGTIPGGDEEGKVDPHKLREWVNRARELAKAAGRLTVCDSAIGQVLAHSGDAEDGSWPIIPVREIIEDVASDRLENGFFVGIMNRRGATWRSITEGGNPTRNLALQWESQSEKCKIKWPRTSATISAVANRYQAEATAEDEDAERRR